MLHAPFFHLLFLYKDDVCEGLVNDCNYGVLLDAGFSVNMGGLELAVLVKQDLLLADRKNEQASVASDREKELLVRTDHNLIYFSRMHAKLLKERRG